jgi:hypothetical protein
MAAEAGGGIIGGGAVHRGPLFPKCIMMNADLHTQIDSDWCRDDSQKLAMAFMFLMTNIPRLTQRCAREMSLHKVEVMAKHSSESMREVFAFLTEVLQDLHDTITRPDLDGWGLPLGLLNQADLRHKGNRHVEVQLRSLRMGLHQVLTMCRSLAEQIAYEATKATGENSAQSLAEMKAANNAVLAQLTFVSGKVDQRVQELTAQPERHDCFTQFGV